MPPHRFPSFVSASGIAERAAALAFFVIALALLASLSGCDGCGPKHLRRYGATCGRNSECTGGVCY